VTIEQLIDQLATMGAAIGLQAEVKAWLVCDPGELQPLDVARVRSVLAGYDKQTAKAVATLKLMP
jgi:hypothetical protein